jgi:hypothetical protein
VTLPRKDRTETAYVSKRAAVNLTPYNALYSSLPNF